MQSNQVGAPKVIDLPRNFFTQHVFGVSFIKFSERTAIQAMAAEFAESEHARFTQIKNQTQFEAQKELDADRALLQNNDPEVLMTMLSEDFGNNEAKATFLGLQGNKVSVLVVTPGLDVLPERDWNITAAGNLSMKRMTAKDRGLHYFDRVASQLVSTLHEGFAVAPGAAMPSSSNTTTL